MLFTLKKDSIKETVNTEITGAEKGKLFPDNIGMVVNDFLVSSLLKFSIIILPLRLKRNLMKLPKARRTGPI